jgi:hypothetical protein
MPYPCSIKESIMTRFARLDRLPPYVFATVNQIKMEARRAGEDIIDLGMGNPDIGTPQHIVDKLTEASQNPRNHRYSASMGITKLRMAISDWYKRRYDVDIDPDSEAIVTIGVKGGDVSPDPGDHSARRCGVCAQPHLSHPSILLNHIRRRRAGDPGGTRSGFFRKPDPGHQADLAPAQGAGAQLPPQPHHRGGGPGFFPAGGGFRQGT